MQLINELTGDIERALSKLLDQINMIYRQNLQLSKLRGILTLLERINNCEE